MKNLLPRIVSWFMTACLLADPTQAVAQSQLRSMAEYRPCVRYVKAPFFVDQAVNVPAA